MLNRMIQREALPLRMVKCRTLLQNYKHASNQGPSLLENFGGTNLSCLRFDDVTMFPQP